jgi:hypothetical protein
MARSSRKPRAASNSVFSLSKRGAKLKSDLPKSKSLVFCFLGFRLSVFNSSVCVAYSSPPKKIETLILTRFRQTTLPFLFSTRLKRKAEQDVPETGRFWNSFEG